MKSGRILILSASHLCRNPRVLKEATTLGHAGYDVTVMSVSSHARFEDMDRELMKGLPFQRKTIDYSAPTKSARLANFLQRCGTWGARLLCVRLRIELAQSLGPAGALLRFARSHPADLTIVHTEIPIWAAEHLVGDGRRVAVDIEDWYSEDLMFADRRSRPLRLLRRAENFVLHHAVYSSTTSQSMASALAETYRCRAPLVIHNTFPLQSQPRTDRPPGGDAPAFIWFSQTIGPGRGLELFFAAWARTTQRSRVCLVGDERPGYRQRLLERIPEHRRGDVTFHPLVTPEALPLKLAEYDLGLALEPHWPRNRDVTISNKIFQYMNAGLALVATDTAGQSEVMRAAPESGLLLQAHETTRNAAALDALLGDPARLRACQNASRAAAVEKFCWEKDAQQLLAAVAGALHPASTSSPSL
ncbi:MAG TPA: glycosyltransferase [Opitutaceae bacterium]|nr:glycosyltransferase [Opitutaceae bacterium]